MPAAMVTYGSHGGRKCAEQLQQVLTGLKMSLPTASVCIPITRGHQQHGIDFETAQRDFSEHRAAILEMAGNGEGPLSIARLPDASWQYDADSSTASMSPALHGSKSVERTQIGFTMQVASGKGKAVWELCPALNAHHRTVISGTRCNTFEWTFDLSQMCKRSTPKLTKAAVATLIMTYTVAFETAVSGCAACALALYL